ncbi:hypothetical protein BC829DRAFT_491614 [Chytridium lagenaria]|nr:hypothetical protein BC829DRAFT_491614 [Chytridium lagenaria]
MEGSSSKHVEHPTFLSLPPSLPKTVPQSPSDVALNPAESSSRKNKRKVEVEVNGLGSPSRQFKCRFPGCTSDFTSIGHLDRHERIHSNERPYKCCVPDCPSKFKRADTAVKHTRGHIRRLKAVGIPCDLSENDEFDVYIDRPPPPPPKPLKKRTKIEARRATAPSIPRTPSDDEISILDQDDEHENENQESALLPFPSPWSALPFTQPTTIHRYTSQSAAAAASAAAYAAMDSTFRYKPGYIPLPTMMPSSYPHWATHIPLCDRPLYPCRICSIPRPPPSNNTVACSIITACHYHTIFSHPLHPPNSPLNLTLPPSIPFFSHDGSALEHASVRYGSSSRILYALAREGTSTHPRVARVSTGGIFGEYGSDGSFINRAATHVTMSERTVGDAHEFCASNTELGECGGWDV